MPESVPFFSGFNDLSNKLTEEATHLTDDQFLNMTEPPLSLKDALFSADWILGSGATAMG